jgi:hypothetical protein
MEKRCAPDLPSAGMIRFRFDGFASLHLRPDGHPEVSARIVGCAAGARAFDVAIGRAADAAGIVVTAILLFWH